jgi:hypothetical protein
LGGVAQGAGQNYLNFISNPTSHPYFSNALGGLLEALRPSENNARLALNDQFRAAGNTGSSVYGQNAMGLESELMRNRGSMASQLLTTMFPQITQALMAPMSQVNGLIQALTLQQQQSQSAGQSQGMGQPILPQGSLTMGGGPGAVQGPGSTQYFYSPSRPSWLTGGLIRS